MKKYITIDNEWCWFRDYTIDHPETRKEIIEHFFHIDDKPHALKRHYTLRFIADTWNVTFKPV